MRLLFVGLGPLGRMIAHDALRRGARIIGGVDYSAALAGRPLDEVCPGAGGGRIARTVEEAFSSFDGGAIDAAVVATSSDLAHCMETFRALLSRGVSVVSTCEELVWPWLRHDGPARELDELCRRHGCRCVGTGVNPGFVMDALPVFLTSVCRRVDRVRVERRQDASTRREPFQRKIGAGLSEVEFDAAVKAGTLRHVGLGESLHFIAHCLGMRVARWDESIEPERSARTVRCAAGEVVAGGIAGVRQRARGWNERGEEVVALDFRAALGLNEPRDRVEIEGDPRLEMLIAGGVHGGVATSAIVLNAVPRLLEASPGLHTMATLALPRCAGG